jgi:broad specificity phosphatase PhoE
VSNLCLVRHGETDWNLTGRWQGQSFDAPSINETGRKQALALLAQLNNLHVTAIYASDLLRSRQTAELIANHLCLGVTLEARLREMNLGKWEGMLLDDIKSQYPREFAERVCNPLHAGAPGGESPMQVVKRVIPAVDEIDRKHGDESVLIVAHGISLSIITCLARGIPLDRLYEYIPGNAKLNHVKWTNSKYVGGCVLRKDSGILSLWAKRQA